MENLFVQGAGVGFVVIILCTELTFVNKNFMNVKKVVTLLLMFYFTQAYVMFGDTD